MIKLNLPSPVMPVPLDVEGVKLYIKREDLIHPEIGGNKYRKLKYNVKEFASGTYTHLITYGGAFSNHIAATAAYCHLMDIPSIGLIRTDRIDMENPTMKKAAAHGMALIPIPRSIYSLKEKSPEILAVLSRYPRPYVIPEGGSNLLALKGVGEIITEITASGMTFDEIFVCGGTGATAAGMIKAMDAKTRLTIINVLKNPSLAQEMIDKYDVIENSNWSIDNESHHGGYAKVTDPLIEFINEFKINTGIPLDPIYTGKLMHAIVNKYSKRPEMQGKRILCIHTGGLQGIDGYNYLAMKKGKALLSAPL